MSIDGVAKSAPYEDPAAALGNAGSEEALRASAAPNPQDKNAALPQSWHSTRFCSKRVTKGDAQCYICSMQTNPLVKYKLSLYAVYCHTCILFGIHCHRILICAREQQKIFFKAITNHHPPKKSVFLVFVRDIELSQEEHGSGCIDKYFVCEVVIHIYSKADVCSQIQM